MATPLDQSIKTIPTTVLGIDNRFIADSRDPQRMNLNDCGDIMTFYLVPPAGQHFSYPVEHLLDGLGTDTRASPRMNYHVCIMWFTFMVLRRK